MFTCMTFVFGGLIEYSMVNVLARRHTEGRQREYSRTSERDSMSYISDRYIKKENGDVTMGNGHVTNTQVLNNLLMH